MSPWQFLRLIIQPALALLPAHLDSPAARAMLIAIALQESDLEHRRQIRGPARSFWQYEDIGIRGVLDHHASRGQARSICLGLCYEIDSNNDGTVTRKTVNRIYEAVEHNDVLAAALARLTLWRIPAPLPAQDAPQEGWHQYLEGWRPGKPHRDPWDARYALAWQTVTR